jgi:hypothetical protein
MTWFDDCGDAVVVGDGRGITEDCRGALAVEDGSLTIAEGTAGEK